MEISVLNIHDSICDFILNTFPQGAFRIDDEGFEYVDDKYISVYDFMYNQIIYSRLCP